MDKTVWLKQFLKSVTNLYRRHGQYRKVSIRDSKWTEFMTKVLISVGRKMNCWVVAKHYDKAYKEPGGEYLNIDAMYFDKKHYKLVDKLVPVRKWRKSMDPFVIPSAVVEHENNYSHLKIAYCLWKLLIVRSPLRVLVCYQRETNIDKLRSYLEKVIKITKLLDDDGGTLYVLIGNETNPKAEWEDYFVVFEWSNGNLSKCPITQNG